MSSSVTFQTKVEETPALGFNGPTPGEFNLVGGAQYPAGLCLLSCSVLSKLILEGRFPRRLSIKIPCFDDDGNAHISFLLISFLFSLDYTGLALFIVKLPLRLSQFH